MPNQIPKQQLELHLFHEYALQAALSCQGGASHILGFLSELYF
jgi:hypothetical protein